MMSNKKSQKTHIIEIDVESPVANLFVVLRHYKRIGRQQRVSYGHQIKSHNFSTSTVGLLRLSPQELIKVGV